tara:strand:- start:3204 stop:3662 length:459 start_codon:yes stop_codon:yes gene_type:complete
MTAIKSNPVIQEDYIIPYPKSGIIIEARKGSKAKGVSVAIGEGVISNDKQIVLGRYNIPNTTDILQIGGGSPSNRQTILSIDKNGEVNTHGGELVVEEPDGIIHELVYTDEREQNTGIPFQTVVADVKKLYLAKEDSEEDTTQGVSISGEAY